MEKIKVLMIDDNVNLIQMVEDYFEDNSKIEIVGKAFDGEEGLNLALKPNYDCIVWHGDYEDGSTKSKTEDV